MFRTSLANIPRRLGKSGDVLDHLKQTFEDSHRLQLSIGERKKEQRELSQTLANYRMLLQDTMNTAVLPPKSTDALHSVAGTLFVISTRDISGTDSEESQIILREMLFANQIQRSLWTSPNKIPRLPMIVEKPEIQTTRLCQIEPPMTKLFRILGKTIYRTMAESFIRVRKTATQRSLCLRDLCAFLTIKLKAATTMKAYIRLTGNENARGPCRTSVFVNALKELGFTGDAVAVGAAIDTDKSGIMTYAKFFRAITSCKF